MPPSRKERLAEFFKRMSSLPAARSRQEAKQQLDDVLNQVEDDLSGIPYNLETSLSDGRLYPPLEDNRHNVPGHPGVARYRSRQHNTFIAKNGAMEIRSTSDESGLEARPPQQGRLLWSKKGHNGKGVWKV